jgi:hypothetical protein
MNAAAAALALAVLAGCTGIDLQSVRRADGTTAPAADEAVLPA